MPKWCPQCGAKMSKKGRQSLCDICRGKLLITKKMENEEKIKEEETPVEEETKEVEPDLDETGTDEALV